jgi:DNA polymerase III epsilon subunit-like protein
MKKINVVVDIETLSLRPDAAIISIAAVPFMLDKESLDNNDKYGYTGVPAFDEMTKDISCPEEYAPFYETIDATSCAMAGLAFDMDTVKFWSEMPDEAKSAIMEKPRVSIRQALEDFVAYLENLKAQHKTDELIIWIQGSDFDLPVLKNAMYKVLGLTPETLPWRYRNIRDARTFMLESLSLVYPDTPVNELYGKLLPYDELTKHNSLHDCMWTALNIINEKRRLYGMLTSGDGGEKASSD